MMYPFGLAVDPNGNVIIGGSSGPAVLAEKTGTFYGQHMKAGYVYGLNAGTPFGLAIDHAGNIVVASGGTSGDVVVIAVKAGTFYGIRMRPGHVYNVAPTTTFNSPSGIAVDAAGNLLIADALGNRVYVLADRSGTFYGLRMRADHVYTVAGGGHHGLGDGGRATQAELSDPSGIAPYGNGLVVLDNGNSIVREVTG
jgi:DNA-binding beta-propeller fold protein YncE